MVTRVGHCVSKFHECNSMRAWHIKLHREHSQIMRRAMSVGLTNMHETETALLAVPGLGPIMRRRMPKYRARWLYNADSDSPPRLETQHLIITNKVYCSSMK